MAEGGRWHRERHGYLSLPLYVREGAVLAMTERVDRPDHPYLDGLTLVVYPGGSGSRTVTVTEPDGHSAQFEIASTDTGARVQGDAGFSWSARVAGGASSPAIEGVAGLSW